VFITRSLTLGGWRHAFMSESHVSFGLKNALLLFKLVS
jgi:hypothetical protein